MADEKGNADGNEVELEIDGGGKKKKMMTVVAIVNRRVLK